MNIFRFIKKLSSEELRVVSQAFKQKKGQDNAIQPSQESAFFNFVLNAPEEKLDDKFICENFTEWDADDINYAKLKSRVYLKILAKTTSDDFILNDCIIDGIERAEARIKRKLLELKIQFGKIERFEPESFFHLLNEIIEESKEFELYDNLIEALSYKKYLLAQKYGYEKYQKIQDEIAYYRELSKAKSEANDYFYEVNTSQSLISHFSEKEMLSFIDEKLKFLEASPYTTVSSRILYFYKQLLFEKSKRSKDYSKCTVLCLEIIGLLDRSKAISTKARYGIAYGNLSHCHTFQREFYLAIDAAKKSQSYFPKGSLNYVLALEQQFFTRFYSQEFTECHELIEEMLNHNKRDFGQVRLDLFTYYSICLDFAEGNFRAAKRSTNFTLTIVKDKSRWGLGIRYLKIMSLVELKEYEEAREAIELLRRQVRRNKTEGKIKFSQRDEIISKAFHEYSACGFEGTNGKLVYLLKLLAMKNSEHSWNFFSHELIPVHKWMKKGINQLSDRKQAAQDLQKEN